VFGGVGRRLFEQCCTCPAGVYVFEILLWESKRLPQGMELHVIAILFLSITASLELLGPACPQFRRRAVL
jgi:hypothetical protein